MFYQELLEKELAENRINKALLIQYKKPNRNKILILAMQMKQDFENVKHDFLNATKKVTQKLKS